MTLERTIPMEDVVLMALRAALPVKALEDVIIGPRAGLLVVDEINGFCTPGAGNLAPPPGAMPPAIATMIERTNGLARAFAASGRKILAFVDTHVPGREEPPYPPHCETGSNEDELVPDLAWLNDEPAATVVRKDVINGFIGSIAKDGSNALVDWINDNRLETVVVVGICTDICSSDLVTTLLSARNHHFADHSRLLPTLVEIVVLDEGNATYDLPGTVARDLGLPETATHPAGLAHHIGLWTMQSRGATIAASLKVA